MTEQYSSFVIDLMKALLNLFVRRVRSERSSDIQWMKQHERCQPNSDFWTSLEAQRTNAMWQTINASQTINGAQQKCTRARDNTRKQNNAK